MGPKRDTVSTLAMQAEAQTQKLAWVEPPGIGMDIETADGQRVSPIPPREITGNGQSTELLPVRRDTPTPTTVLLEAYSKGASVEMLAKLLELQERWEAGEARKAFARDLAAFKADAPRLEKVREVDFTSKSGTRVHFKYTPLDYTCEKLGPVLSRHNLSHSWDVDQSDPSGKVKVTCLLEHSMGHIKRVSMESPMIDDQRMNVLQRLKATVSMLQRYTLESAAGVAGADMDSEFEGTTNGRAADFLALINEAKSVEELKEHYQAARKDGIDKKDPKAIGLYAMAFQKRQQELGGK